MVGHVPKGEQVAELLKKMDMAGVSGEVPGCVRRLAGAHKGKNTSLIRQLQQSPDVVETSGRNFTCTGIKKKDDMSFVSEDGRAERIMVPKLLRDIQKRLCMSGLV